MNGRLSGVNFSSSPDELGGAGYGCGIVKQKRNSPGNVTLAGL